MGIKIKKNEGSQLEKLPVITLRYSLVVPLMGIVDMLTMASFYMNPAAEGRPALKGFYVVCALIGVVFAVWGLLWKTSVDGKRIRVRPVFGASRNVPFSDLKTVVIHKKKKSGAFSYYELLDKNGGGIVKVYPLMKDSSLLLERFKRLGIRIEEKTDR